MERTRSPRLKLPASGRSRFASTSSSSGSRSARVAGILPWNFLFFLVVRKLAPALVTGNTIVIKPSEETPVNAFEFAKLVAETKLPPGVVNFISGLGDTVGHRLASHRGIGMVSFTGSVETGSKIMAAAAENLTKVNLELGGKAPAIVLSDANLDLAVEAIKNSRIINSGQVCNCAERAYVHEKIADAFTDRLAKAMKVSKFGNPLEDLSVDYGPLINQEGLSKVEGMVSRATKDGATVVTGGRRGDIGKILVIHNRLRAYQGRNKPRSRFVSFHQLQAHNRRIPQKEPRGLYGDGAQSQA